MKMVCEYCGKEYELEEGQLNWGKGNISKKAHGVVSSKKYCSYDCGRAHLDNKRRQANLNKYGYGNPFENKYIQEQIKQTNLRKYGKEYYTQTDEYVQKSKETCIEKYGVDSPNKCEKVKRKQRESLKQHYNIRLKCK